MSEKIIACPQCGEDAVWAESNPHRPFCSERCRQIDLGAWASEEYQIATGDNRDANDFSTGNEPGAEEEPPHLH